MKVLVCIPCLMTGGTEIQTLSLVEALIAANHDVTVACYFEYSPAMVERYHDAGARVRFLSVNNSRPTGIKDTVIYLWNGLRSIVKDLQPDVAHVQYMAPGALPIIILRLLGVKKIIATSHTPADIYSPIGRRLIRILSRTCLTAFQCITERAEKSYFDTSQIFSGSLCDHFTIYNSLPSHISIIKQPRKHLTDSDTITVGVVSRLEYIKGMDLVVPAFALVANSDLRLRLLIIGDGTQRELMEKQVRSLGLDDRVEFVGRKVQAELPDYYDRIDILLMPSRSEGFGLTAIEGMARGCVPIVAETGGLPEVVTCGSGLLHKPEDIDSIADKIGFLVSDNNRFSSLSAGALERAKIFSSESYSNAIASLYDLL